ncbi:MAG: YigZ family protein [Bacteroidales bacterium]
MSKFISFAMPISSVDEAKEVIVGYRNKYHDARHVCWGYRIGCDGDISRSSDDGEPSGTAGKPILGQLLSNDITNILIVIVRYFGGIKLGTGGLIVAYREAAADAIRNNQIVERVVEKEMGIEFDYIDIDSVMRLLKDEYVSVKERNFDNRCRILLSVQLGYADTLVSLLSKIESVKYC